MSSAPLSFSTESANSTGQVPRSLRIELTVDDPPAIATLCEYQVGEERNRFALRALLIGLQALDQARSRIDVDTIRQEGHACSRAPREATGRPRAPLERADGAHPRAGISTRAVAGSTSESNDSYTGWRCDL